jgi:hypothetical protein
MATPNRLHFDVRSSRGDAKAIVRVEAESGSSAADVKRLLCIPPHNLCAEPQRVVLVHKGTVAPASTQQ